MNRISVLVLFATVLMAGCSGTLKSGWDNFRAYYNTYYNAKEYYSEGQKAIRDQPRTLNPELPVRVHPPPVDVGGPSFEQAIEKCSLILRRHSGSAWVDDALLLMGKSYYYLQDYAAAIKRLEQVGDVDSSPSIQRQAKIWKGRAMLDLGIYSQGIMYLEEVLGDYPADGTASQKGELQVLAGEHHAQLENWEQASMWVAEGLSNLTDRKLRGAAFFLHGQLLERQGRLEEAYYAFGQVPSHFVGDEYEFWSRIKQAEVSRELGNVEVALAIYGRMQHNDKFVDRRERLTFEMARALEMQGAFEEAEAHYGALLYGEQLSESRTLQADTYYRMGSIQSTHYQNYTMAAAYFDTSASLRDQPEDPADKEAAALAETFVQYADLKEAIHRADSLLRLGAMPQEQLDSLIERVKTDKRRELLARQEGEPNEDRMMNQPTFPDTPDTSTRSSIYGFLNHRSQPLVDEARAEFRIIWGDRPLVDNWRRQSVIRQTAEQRKGKESGTPPGEESLILSGEEPGDEQTTAALNLNVEAIPRSEAEQAQMKANRANYQYQIGNLLFLNLEQPDSARVYYHKVIHGRHHPGLRPRAMYALYEIFRTSNQTDSLRYWADRIRIEYSDSEYARFVEKGDIQ